jgi:hypothetical protein
MRVWKHFTVVYHSDIQLRAELWLILLTFFLILNFISLLIEDHNWLRPLIWLNFVLSRKLFKLFEHCWIFSHLLRELQ